MAIDTKITTNLLAVVLRAAIIIYDLVTAND